MVGWDGIEPPTPGFSDPAPPPLRRPSCPTIASIPATFLHFRRAPSRVIPRMPGRDFSRVVAEPTALAVARLLPSDPAFC